MNGMREVEGVDVKKLEHFPFPVYMRLNILSLPTDHTIVP
jgi:hypothetical protein